ncbi:MAG: DUF4347 domain-containing protein, partial [Desulfosarcinaceae bacterium]|nr:DUF4347 domain-containing protein [Desulfosarcinaceae bacterium]
MRVPAKKRKTPSASIGVLFEPLEPRLLLSGTWGTGAEDSGGAGASPVADGLGPHPAALQADIGQIDRESQANHRPQTHGRVDLLAEAPVLATASQASMPIADENSAPQVQSSAVASREVVFVDTGIDDYARLVQDVLASADDTRNMDVILLNADGDGIDQVSQALASRQDLAAIHFLTHGDAEGIALGSTRLNGESVQAHAADIAGWKAALAPQGDILFYGCELASGEEGRTLLTKIGALSDADVAASDDLTGSKTLGGDWDLEYRQGSVETGAAVSTSKQARWSGVLAQVTVDTVNDLADGGDTTSIASLIATPGTDGISLREAIIATNNESGQADEIILPSGHYILSLGPAGDENAASGDLDITDALTITGADASTTIIDANGLDRVFHLNASAANLTLTDLTIQGGDTTAEGGGIYVEDGSAQLIASRVIVTGNLAGNGGGIYNRGTITLTDVVISDNGYAGTFEGGGLHNKEDATLTNVTLSGNRSDRGGGIHNDNTATSLSLTNVTISGNTAADTGGGLYNQNPATLDNVTVTLNTASTAAGIFNEGAATEIDIRNTIVAGNLTAADVAGSFNSLGYNLIGDRGTVTDFVQTGDQAGTSGSPIDPILAALGDNGGFTMTHLPLGGSPVVDAGTATGPPVVDQRGISRPLDGDGDTTAAVDIGAIEVEPDALVHAPDLGNPQETSAETRGSHQAVAMDVNGNYVVVWSSLNEDGSGWGVFGQRFDVAGTAVGSKFQVNDTLTDTDNQRWATVAMDAAGNFVVTWTSDNQDSNIQSVYARGFNADATEAFAEFKVNTHDVSNLDEQRNPSVAMAADGRFVIAWEGAGPGDSHGIFFRRFNADGTARDAVDQPASGTDRGTEATPAVAINDSGDFAIAWQVGSHIYARSFGDDGLPLWGEVWVDTLSSSGTVPDLAIDATGRVTVVYRSNNLLHDGIWKKTFASDGTPGAPIQVDQNSIQDSTHPSITMDSAGNYLIVYEGSGDGDGLGVFARKYDASGTPLTDEFQINQTATGLQHMASAAMFDSDSFVVVWSGEGPDETSGVFTRRFGTMTGTNDAPTASGVPTDVSVTEDAASDFDLSGVSFADVDGDSLTVT